MLAELVGHVIGVDPDLEFINVAVVDAKTTGVVTTGRFPATAAGYGEAMLFADGHSVATERAWAIEGTASYGRGLTVALARAGEWVIEFDRATSKSKDGAKSDELDAVRAAREALGRAKLATPRSPDGDREAIRVHALARDGAVRARTAAINELKAMIVTADESLRAQLRGLTTVGQVNRCDDLDVESLDTAQRHTATVMRLLAQRIKHLNVEIRDHDRALKELLDRAAPQLLTEPGIGYTLAAQLVLAWSHPGRCRNDAAFARLAGVSPVPATSGKNQQRHRLSRGGDRQLNRALYLVATTRRRCHPETKSYIARRVADGNTEREAIRCLKRYIARHVWRLLEHPPERP
jgi:transposase